MTLLEQVKILIKQGKLSPNKLRGQNFCINEKVLEQMVSASNIAAIPNVLEIGPGLGFLTERLQEKAKKLVAVEIENDFKKILEAKKMFWQNTEIIWQDILHLNNLEISKLFNNEPYQIITNLPYSLSGIFFRKFLSQEPKPACITAMLQQEVGERIVGQVGAMTLLGLQGQIYSQPKIVAKVLAEDFWPKPKVQSVIVRFDKITNWIYDQGSEKRFWQLARIGFSAKRKTLANNLSAGLKIDRPAAEKMLAKVGILPSARAQELSTKQWLDLVKVSD